MKRFGTIALMLFAFLVGFVSTYSCGGGGSSAEAAGDADTLEGYSASDFAFSTHGHAAGDISGGVLDISLIPAHTHSEHADSQHSHDSGDLLDGGIHNIHITGRASIAGTAETLDGLDSSDFAVSAHSHPAASGTRIGVFSIPGNVFHPVSSITRYAAIHLPHLAQIAAVTAYWADVSNIDEEVLLRRQGRDGSVEYFASIITSETIVNFGSASASTIFHPIVDNSAYGYYVVWDDSDPQVHLLGLEIDYLYSID